MTEIIQGTTIKKIEAFCLAIAQSSDRKPQEHRLLKRYTIPKEYLYVALPIAITLGIYLPNLGGSYIGMDVPVYLKVMEGLDLWVVIKASFASFHGELVSGYYAPFAAISLAFDRLIASSSSPDAKVTLFINLLIHCLNGGLVYQLLRKLSIPMAMASLAALIFLIHPLQATSILWFAERKTLLSSAFCLLSLINYIAFRLTENRIKYFVSIVCFVAALLTKPVTATFPAILLFLELMDVKHWNKGFDHTNSMEWKDLKSGFKEGFKHLLPFLVLAGISVFLTMRSERAATLPFPWNVRPLIAGAALWFYISKILIPTNLVYVYPKWSPSLTNWVWYMPIIGTIPLLALIYRLRTRSALILGCACLFIPLSPALGIVPFGWYLKHSFVGDHFVYFSMMGAALILCYCVHAIANRKPSARPIFLIITASWLMFLGAQTFNQTKIWTNANSLWSHVIENNPLYAFAYMDLALDRLGLGKYEECRALLEKSLKLKPDSFSAHYFMGVLNAKQGFLDKAEESFRKAIKSDPEQPGPYNELGIIKMGEGKLSEAESLFKKAIGQPFLFDPYNNLGAVEMQMGQYAEAAENFQKALKMNGRSAKTAKTLANLGFSMLALNRSAEGMEALKGAVELDPELVEAQNELAVQYFRSGNYDEAGAHAEKALSLKPDIAESKEIMSKLQRVQ